MIQKVHPGILMGTVFAPPSKSYAQRAVLAAALASGTSRITNLDPSGDTKAVLSAVSTLGASVSDGFSITGCFPFASSDIDVGESGLATRLLIPLLSLSGTESRITGRGSLLSRRMDFMVEPLSRLGVDLRLSDGTLPAVLRGPLRSADFDIDCSESSQFLSGLLFALPLAEGDSIIRVRNLASRPYIQLTLDILKTFGIAVETDSDTFRIPGCQSYSPADYAVEGDWSGVSTLLVTPGRKTVRGLNPDSLQGDKSIIGALKSAGVNVRIMGSDITVTGPVLSPFEFDATDCPDLFPALAVLAARVPAGTSSIKGTDRLLNKESNRLLAIRDEFEKFGVNVDVSMPNVLKINGGQRIVPAEADSHHDHRIAMAAACLGLCAAEGESTVSGAEAVNKSYRNFWNDFKMLYRYE